MLFGSDFVSALQSKFFKRRLINYLCYTFVALAKTKLQENQTLTIDSSTFGTSPLEINMKGISNPQQRQNNKGEADCAVWFHACKSSCSHIIICANDTDIWVYGLALLERDKFNHRENIPKQVCIELSYQREYVDINNCLLGLQNYNCLQRLSEQKLAGSAILAIYLLSGSDYLSTFFGLSAKSFFQTFCSYVNHISPNEDLLIKTEQRKGTEFHFLSENAFVKLVCCTYLEKYKNLFKHIRGTPPELFELFQVSTDNQSNDLKCLLEWIGYDKKENFDISSMASWTEFTRRMCYFSNHGSQNLYRLIPPSDTALSLQKARIEFVLNIACQSTVPFSDLYSEIDKFGWKINEGNVEIVWEENIDSLKKDLSSKRKLPIHKCSCQTTKEKCAVSSRGCKNCCKACKPCNPACKCRGLCENPHNGGGTCEKCCSPESKFSLQSKEENQLNEASSDESDTEQTFISEESDMEDSDNDKDLEQQIFYDYFSDDEQYLKMPEKFSFTEIDPNTDIYFTDIELMSDSDDE